MLIARGCFISPAHIFRFFALRIRIFHTGTDWLHILMHLFVLILAILLFRCIILNLNDLFGLFLRFLVEFVGSELLFPDLTTKTTVFMVQVQASVFCFQRIFLLNWNYFAALCIFFANIGFLENFTVILRRKWQFNVIIIVLLSFFSKWIKGSKIGENFIINTVFGLSGIIHLCLKGLNLFPFMGS
jgi:hypothetical protein